MLLPLSLLIFLELPLIAASSHGHRFRRQMKESNDATAEEEREVLSSLISEFMVDSKSQLVVDMDLFWDIYAYGPSKMLNSLNSGNESFSLQLLDYLNQLKVSIFESLCLSSRNVQPVQLTD